MSRSILIAVLVLTCLVGMSLAQDSHEVEKPKLQRWEYNTMSVGTLDKSRLNGMGNDGWELVGFQQWGTSRWAYVFKRPIQ